MDPVELRKREDAALLVAKVFAFAFAVSVFIYPLVIAAIVGEQYLGPGFHGESRALVYAVVVAALLLLVAASRMEQFLLDMARKKNYGSSNPAVFSAWLLSIVVGFALRDVAATLGFVLSFITRNLFWCVLLGVLALIAMGRNWPTRERMGEFLKRLE